MPDADCPGGFCRRNMRCTERRLCHMIFRSSRLSKLIYNMVRIIAGTLIQVGKGKFNPEYVKEMLDAKDRTQAGQTAPPQGLTLMRIEYL